MNLVYLDAACTQAVAIGDPGQAGHVRAIETSASITSCETTTSAQIVTLGSELTPTPPLFRLAGGACEHALAAHAYAITASADDSALVELTPSIVPVTPTVDAKFYAGTDGSFVFTFGPLRDRAHAADVLPGTLAAVAGTYWLPIVQGPLSRGSSTALDAGSCPSAFDDDLFSIGCPPPVGTTVAVQLSGGPPGPSKVVRATTVVARAWSCYGFESGHYTVGFSDGTFLKTGPSISVCEFEPDSTLPMAGGTRVRDLVQPQQHTVGGAALPVGPTNSLLHDDLLGVDCSIEPASDGTPRCLPRTGNASGPVGWIAYTDAACTLPVVTVLAGSPKPGFARQPPMLPAGVCSSEVYDVGGALAAPAELYSSYTATPNTCGSCLPSAIAGRDFYALGTAVPPGTFAAFSIVQR